MKDIGVDRREGEVAETKPSSSKYYPSITFNDSVIPSLKDKEVGDKVKLTIEIKILGSRLPETWDEMQKGKYLSCEIRKVGEPE